MPGTPVTGDSHNATVEQLVVPVPARVWVAGSIPARGNPIAGRVRPGSGNGEPAASRCPARRRAESSGAFHGDTELPGQFMRRAPLR